MRGANEAMDGLDSVEVNGEDVPMPEAEGAWEDSGSELTALSEDEIDYF